MAESGFQIVDAAEDADIALVNTCGFLQIAVEEGIGVILELERLKKSGVISRLAVVGCMVNRYGTELMREFPSVDYWARSEDWNGLLSAMRAPVPEKSRFEIARADISGKPWTRVLKISEGCNCNCAYCAIPGIRGRLRSREIRAIVDEAHHLVDEGAKELCLVGQELSMYGADLFGKPSLPALLDVMEEELPTDVWLRLFYLHPSYVNRGFLERVASSRHILPWLDVPIQHIDDAVLRRMNRPPVEEHIWDLFRWGREVNPDFAFRTTLMVGFPGETRDQFDKLLDFVEDIRFDRLGAFTYSPEEGTPAATFPDQIPEEVKAERYNELMELQQSVSIGRQAMFVGRTLDVLIDEIDGENGCRVGRSFRDAPEIDGIVSVYGADDVLPGDRIRVKITDSDEYNLTGEPVRN